MPGLLDKVSSALAPAFAAQEPGADPIVRRSGVAGFDFQANGAMGLAKRLGRNPVDIATDVAAGLREAPEFAAVEVAPRGFINLRLSPRWLAGQLLEMAASERLGRDLAVHPRRVVVDYSSPNVAKEMHAGHLRGTIIGDCLTRLYTDAGHEVIRQNHLGDWGTPFGMLIEHLVDLGEERTAEELSVGDLDGFYKEARRSFDASDAFKTRSRDRVVALQAGDSETLRLWRILVGQSVTYFSRVYRLLGVLMTAEDTAGESMYNDALASVIDELDGKGMIQTSEGAACVFPAGFTGRDGKPLPLIVRKSDGGYGYATTDLAAIRHRFVDLKVDLSLYVVGSPQAEHFKMVFATAREAGWIPQGTEPVHVQFGNVLGEDRKMLKSRSGASIKLVEVLEEAVERAARAVAAKNPELSGEEVGPVAGAVGIGALKYADLSVERTKDYVFDWDRMLAFEGNTGPYLQYARARINSIFRRAGLSQSEALAGAAEILLEAPQELELAVILADFPTAVGASMEGYAPHRLCTYLYEVAGAFTSFYEHCSVLKAEDRATRESRLKLCALAAEVLRQGLGLLGIEAPERM